MWIVGYAVGFWFAPVIAFGGMIVLYAVICLLFTALPTAFTSTLFILLGLAGLFFAP